MKIRMKGKDYFLLGGMAALLCLSAWADVDYKKCGTKASDSCGCDKDHPTGVCSITTYTPAMPVCVKSTSIDDCIWHTDPPDPLFQIIRIKITEETGHCVNGACVQFTMMTESEDFAFFCTGT